MRSAAAYYSYAEPAACRVRHIAATRVRKYAARHNTPAAVYAYAMLPLRAASENAPVSPTRAASRDERRCLCFLHDACGAASHACRGVTRHVFAARHARVRFSTPQHAGAAFTLPAGVAPRHAAYRARHHARCAASLPRLWRMPRATPRRYFRHAVKIYARSDAPMSPRMPPSPPRPKHTAPPARSARRTTQAFCQLRGRCISAA